MRLVTDIHLVPLLWRHLALLGELAAAVEGFLVDDVQDDLGIDIAAGGTGRGVGVGVVCRCLEIGDGIDGIAVENRIAALVEKPQAVEEFIYIARRLVDVHHDEFAFVCLLLQEIDYLLCVGGRQAGSGLVEKEYDRLMAIHTIKLVKRLGYRLVNITSSYKGPACGDVIELDYNFCPNCGRKLSWEDFR